MDPCPLSQAHCDVLTKICQSCATTQEWIDAAKRAGLDVSPFEESNRVQAAQAAGLKREYFPDRP